MSRHRKDPLRPLTADEHQELTRLSRPPEEMLRERCPARPVPRLEEKMGSGWNDELFGETF